MYSALFSAAIAKSTYDSVEQYKTTYAPFELKVLRHVFNLASFAHYSFAGIYSVYTLGDDSLLNLFRLNQIAADVIANLPPAFLISLLTLELAKTTYKIWKATITPNDTPLKAMEIMTCVINYSFMVAITLSATSVLLSPTIFPNLGFGFIAWMSWQGIIHVMQDLLDQNKNIDWDYIYARIYLNGTVAVLFTLRALRLLTIGGALFDSMLCFNAANYLLLKSISDLQNAQEITAKLILQLGIAAVEILVGSLLLTGVLVIPSTAFVGVMFLAAIKSLSMLPAISSVGLEIHTRDRIHSKTKELINNQSKNATEYLTKKYDSELTAKDWVKTHPTNYSLWNHAKSTTNQWFSDLGLSLKLT